MTSIEKLVYNLVYNNLVDNSPNSKFWEIIEQVKQIHKQEIIDAYMDRMDITDKEAIAKIIGEQYYQETYGKAKQ
jgi:hypothetical protein